MGTIFYFIIFFSYTSHFLIPINLGLVSNNILFFHLIFYSSSILFFSLQIKNHIIQKNLNYDVLFLILTLWISNFISYIYFNIFKIYIISFSSTLISLICVIFLIKEIKKINKCYPKYLIPLLIFYIYLSLFIIKFI